MVCNFVCLDVSFWLLAGFAAGGGAAEQVAARLVAGVMFCADCKSGCCIFLLLACTQFCAVTVLHAAMFCVGVFASDDASEILKSVYWFCACYYCCVVAFASPR